MPTVIRSPETKIVTKNGETTLSISVEPIVIEITLNLNTDGVVNIASTNAKPKETPPEEDKPAWVVPQFSSMPKVKFGKSVGE
jgi:hypothetical protein